MVLLCAAGLFASITTSHPTPCPVGSGNCTQLTLTATRVIEWGAIHFEALQPPALHGPGSQTLHSDEFHTSSSTPKGHWISVYVVRLRLHRLTGTQRSVTTPESSRASCSRQNACASASRSYSLRPSMTTRSPRQGWMSTDAAAKGHHQPAPSTAFADRVLGRARASALLLKSCPGPW